jgi:hypothetical protein
LSSTAGKILDIFAPDEQSSSAARQTTNLALRRPFPPWLAAPVGNNAPAAKRNPGLGKGEADKNLRHFPGQLFWATGMATMSSVSFCLMLSRCLVLVRNSTSAAIFAGNGAQSRLWGMFSGALLSRYGL